MEEMNETQLPRLSTLVFRLTFPDSARPPTMLDKESPGNSLRTFEIYSDIKTENRAKKTHIAHLLFFGLKKITQNSLLKHWHHEHDTTGIAT